MAAPRIPGLLIGALLIAGIALAAQSARGADSGSATTVVRGSFYRLEGGVPPGFEQLTAPQRALVDVYFGKRHVTRQMATYTPDSLLFDDPAAIAAVLPESVDPEALQQGLGAALPVNADRLCRYTDDLDCDRLQPDAVGVIFDAADFRADLFVNPRLLVTQPVQRDRYLPPSDTGLSMLQNFVATTAGSDRTEQMLSVGSFTTIAYDDARLVSEANYADDYGVTIDRLFLQRDRDAFEYAGGLFRTVGRAFAFSGDQQLGGVRVASTLNTRTDLGLAYGTPIPISLTSRARVDLIKDGRLVSSRFYDAGNQMVDTSTLPEGAYDLVIRINEAGAVREETRFFSKSSRLPPKDQPLYQVEAGALLDAGTDSLFPEDTGEWMARIGHSRRLTQNFGFDAGLAGTGSDQLVELGLFRMNALGEGGDDFYELQASSFAGTGSSSGVSLSGQLRFGDVYAGVDVRSVNSDTAADPAYGDPLGAGPAYGYGAPSDAALSPSTLAGGGALSPSGASAAAPSLIPETMDQANLTVQFPLLGGVAGITASEIRRPAFDDVSRQSLTFRRSILERLPGVAEFRADLNFEGDKVQALVGVRFHLRRDRWSSDVTPRYRYDDVRTDEEDPHGYQVDVASQWTDPDFAGGELRLETNASKQSDADAAGVAAELDNRFAQTRLSVDRFQGPDYDETSWAGTVFTSVLTGDDAWAVGGQNASDAAVLVTLDGRSPETDYEVIVDDYRRGYARGGTTTALHLPAYRTYEVRIKPRRSAFVEFDDSPRTVTLYPGNVARLQWEVKSLFVVLGRVVDSEGRGIPNARISGVQGMAATDAEGFFQAEVASGDDAVELEFETAAGHCSVTAPIVQKRRGVAFLQTLSCDPVGGLARAD